MVNENLTKNKNKNSSKVCHPFYSKLHNFQCLVLLNNLFSYFSFLSIRFAFRCTRMDWICDSNTCLSIYLFGNGSRSTFVTKIATSPIYWIGKDTIACETPFIIIQHNATPLWWLKMGNFLEFGIIIGWTEWKKENKTYY